MYGSLVVTVDTVHTSADGLERFSTSRWTPNSEIESYSWPAVKQFELENLDLVSTALRFCSPAQCLCLA